MEDFKEKDIGLVAACLSQDKEGSSKFKIHVNKPIFSQKYSADFCAAILISIFSEIESAIDDDKQIKFAKEVKESLDILFKTRDKIIPAITI